MTARWGRTAAQLAALDPVGESSRIEVESDTGRGKQYDGLRPWSDLPYLWAIPADVGGGGGGGATNLAYDAATRVVSSDTGTDATLTLADGTNPGLFASADFTKLAGVATGATANATDAALRDRATHTGSQATSTITGLDGTLATASSLILTNISNIAANTAAIAGKANTAHTHVIADTTGLQAALDALVVPGARIINNRIYNTPGAGVALTNTTRSLLAGTAYVGLFVPRVNIPFDAIGVNITTGVAATTIHALIYADDSGVPGALLHDSGALSSATTGFPNVAVSGTLLAGVPYWCGVLALGGNPVVRAAALGNTLDIGGSASGTANTVTSVYARAGLGAPADPFGAITATVNFAPPLVRLVAVV